MNFCKFGGSRFLVPAVFSGMSVFLRPASAVLPSATHPAFDQKEIGFTDKYHTMGIGFLSDGRMAFVTSGIIGGGEVPEPDANSCVFIASGVTGNGPVQVTKIASGFRQPSGINVVNDKIYVSDRDAFYSIPSNNAPSDLNANKTKVLSWPMGSKWHQWIFTPIYKDGKFYAPYSGSIRVGGPSDVPASSDYSGAFLSWNPDGTGLTKFAGGLRSPNGANIDDQGEMFVVDGQGSWEPTCTFLHMNPNKFYGHRQSPPNAPNWAEKLTYQPPAVWIPYPSQVVGASTSQPIYVKTGPYAGQWFAGDDNGPGLTRFALEKVNGEFQGAVFRFSNGTSNAGINRLAWGPDGALYMGTMEHYGNWPGSGLMPIYKMTPKANPSVFEMLAIHSYQGGMEIEFTQPVDKNGLGPANFSVMQWNYTRVAEYGGGKGANETRTVSSVQVSDDGKRVFLQIPGLKTLEYVVAFKLTGVKPAQGTATLWDNEAWYTLNAASTRVWNPAVDIARHEAKVSALSSQLKVLPSASGSLIVEVSAPGAYALSLRTLDGKEVSRFTGNGPGKYPLTESKRGHGVYVLEIRQGRATFSRPLVF